MTHWRLHALATTLCLMSGVQAISVQAAYWTPTLVYHASNGMTHVHMFFGCDPHCPVDESRNGTRPMSECMEAWEMGLRWPNRVCRRWMPWSRSK